MTITYHGGEFFKIISGDTTIAINPVSKDSKIKTTHFGADIAIISLNDKDFNGVEQLSRGEKEPFVISGPGEYEAKKVFVKGFQSVSEYKEQKRINTIYSIMLEGINLVFLGALSLKKLNNDTKEALGDIDILFTPIGGSGVLAASDARALSVELEPKIIIPMHYGEIENSGKNKALEEFLKEDGAENGKSIDKFTIKKKELEGKEEEVVILNS